MTVIESIYIATTVPTECNKEYLLTGLDGQSYNFEHLHTLQFKLKTYNNEIINVYQPSKFACSFQLKTKTQSTQNLEFHSKLMSSGYNIQGQYINSLNKLNWSWKKSRKSETGSFKLVDNNNNKRVVARISGLSLDGQESGMICIARDLPVDLVELVLVTGCLIWNIKD
jgi:DNA modification methylase